MSDLDEKFEQFLEKTGIKLLLYQKVLAKKMLHHEPITYVPPRGTTRYDTTRSFIASGIVVEKFMDEESEV